MQLRFLGQTYSAANNCLETIPSEYTVRFLGQTYTTHRPLATFNARLSLRKKYRGVAYDV